MTTPVETAAAALVFALVITYNAPAKELAACVAALQQQSLKPAEVLIVDNHSDEPLAFAALRALGDVPVQLLRLDENIGPGGGYAAGMIEFLRSDCTHIWLLDDDVITDPECLAQHLATLASHPDGAVAMPRLIETRNGSVNDEINTWWGALLPRRAVETCGFPESKFFYSLEDQEYFIDRLPLAGFPAVRSTTAIVRMLQREPTSIAPWKIYYIVRNSVYRYLWERRHIPTSTRLKSLANGLRFWWRCAWSDRPQRRAKLTYFVRGVVDGLLRRLGKRVDPPSADRSWSTLPE